MTKVIYSNVGNMMLNLVAKIRQATVAFPFVQHLKENT
jgi:hypothetical protein